MLHYNLPPVIEIRSKMLEARAVRLFVRREDLNNSKVSGNKYWKLKYNLEEALSLNLTTVLTFGGAYSNHIYATSAACKLSGLRSIGIIRGELRPPLNATLSFARENGMQLHFIDRESYRAKTDREFLMSLREKFGEFYLIPEGGTNRLALRGCSEFARDHLLQSEFDYLFLPVGTGGTIAGFICGLEGQHQICGVPVLKDGAFLNSTIEDLVKKYSGKSYGNWSLLTSYHHGGYARVTSELLEFIVMMKTEHNLPLDHVYTAKMMWAIFKEIEVGSFAPGTRILAVHTGGLQGALSTGA